MSEIIDVLTLIPAESPQFTVDIDAVSHSVPLAMPGQGDFILHASGGRTQFFPSDNFIILSFGIVFPENFVMARNPDNPLQASLRVRLDISYGATLIPVSQFGGEDGMQLPLENYELPVNVYVPMAGYPAFQLKATMLPLDTGIDPQVSMISIPTALDETLQCATVFFKILHNKPMIAIAPPPEIPDSEFSWAVVPT